MTDILLVQPPIRDFYLTAKRTVPYGLARMAAVLEAAGFSVAILDALATSRARIIDWPAEMAFLKRYYKRNDRSPFALFHRYRHYGYSFEHLAQKARQSGAFLVGISSLFSAYSREAVKTATMIKAVYPDCKIVMGGHHPTQMPESVMKNPAVDFVIRGEGEAALHHLARSLISGNGLEDIPGIVYRNTDGSIHVSEPVSNEDMDQLPLPATHLLRQDFYRRGQKASVVVVAGRGCPLGCSYCAMRRSGGGRRDRRSIASVLSEIELAVARDGAGFIDFEDENLSHDRRWFLNLLNEIMRRFAGTELELRAMNGLFPPSLDDEIIAAMAAAGFRTINLSLGSSVYRQLKRFERPDVRSAFDAALAAAQKHGLEAVGYVIAAAPYQSPADSVADLLYLAQRRVLAGVSIFYPAPGSPDFRRCRDLSVLPEHLSLMRSSALPIDHTTTRRQAATLLRLGRILNFMKLLLDEGAGLPAARPYLKDFFLDPADRFTAGATLLSWFLQDGEIRGLTSEGRVYRQNVSKNLTLRFLKGLENITLRGCR